MNEWAAQHFTIAAALVENASCEVLAGWADANGVRLSAGRTGCCRDNAVRPGLAGEPRVEICNVFRRRRASYR